MPGQLWAILHLKWQLLRNGWSGRSTIALVAGIVMAVLLVPLVALMAIGAFLLGPTVVEETEPAVLLLIFDGVVIVYLFFWIMSLLTEVQRHDSIDLRKLLYLPVQLPLLFLFNFLATLISFSVCLFYPQLLAFVAGVYVRRDFSLGLGIGLVTGFILLSSALAFYLRGMIAASMQSPKRRRILAVVMPLCMILFTQIPFLGTRLISNVEWGRQFEDDPASLLIPLEAINRAIPLGWMPLGVWSLLQGRPGTAALCLGGLVALTVGILCLAYRGTLRFYTHGPTQLAAKKIRPARRPITLRRLPFFAEDTTALAWASFLILRRHPVVRLSFISALGFGAFLYAITFLNTQSPPGLFRGVGASQFMWVFWPFLAFSNIMFNSFGYDRGGFRALVLLPTPRHRYLLANNLALFPLVGGTALCFALISAVLLRPTPSAFLLGMIQILQFYVALACAGNFMSIYFPYQVSNDPMRQRQNRGFMLFVGLLSMATLMLIALPTSLCVLLHRVQVPGWPVPLLSPGMVLALVLLAVSLPLYRWSLIRGGDALLARETRILETLVRDRD